jgi:histidyl-tRNA synthetase
MSTCEALRAAGISVQMHAGGGDGRGSMKSQFRKADASGARYAIIFGADERARGAASVKSLRDAAAAQRTVVLDDVAMWAATLTA